ncbi:MAG TPA: hypothetical protein VF485_10460 [Sphingomonas sp.]
MTVTTSEDLLQLCYEAVLNVTDAQNRVYKPGDWPSQDEQYPLIKMRLIHEARTSLGRGGAFDFLTVATIRLTGEVSAPATIDDAGATGAESALWRLKRQIEVAVINSYPLTKLIQNIPTIVSQLDFSSEGATHLAGVRIDLQLEFYEGPESFAPVAAVDLEEVTIANTTLPPTGIAVDLPT